MPPRSDLRRHVRGVYALTPSMEDGDELLHLCRQALDGGVSALQLRYKGADRGVFACQAQQLRKLTLTRGAVLVVNDDVDIALEAQADGIHVGPDDASPAQVRRRVGHEILVGVSCRNSVSHAAAALGQGADYISFGAVHPTKTKPQAVQCTHTELREAREMFPGATVVAIGGIEPHNAASTLATGVDAIAVCNGIFGAADIRIAAAQLTRMFNGNETIV